jgi:hypothetical protein
MDMSKLMALMADKKASMQKHEKTAKIAPGENNIRLLPGWRKGEEYIWFHDFGQHFVKDATDKIQAVYVCTEETFGRTCEVCSAISKAGAMGVSDDVLAVLAKAKASRSVLVNALMLDSDQPNTPVILELKRGVFSQLVDIVTEWSGSPLAAEGQIIKINREGKGLTTKYSAQISPKTHKVPAAALAKLNDLDAYVKQESEEQQRKAIGAVNGVAGLFATGTGDVPLTSSSATRLSAPSSDPSITDVGDFTETTTSSSSSLDSELDALLGDLGD